MNGAAEVATSKRIWMGPDGPAAERAFVAARELGVCDTGALFLANMASFVDCWAHGQSIADHVGRSRRTFQRYVALFKGFGALFTRRSRPGEIPPRATAPASAFACGFAHKWVVGRDRSGPERHAAMAAARGVQIERILARDEFTHSLARKLGLPREIRRLGAAATIAAAVAAHALSEPASREPCPSPPAEKTCKTRPTPKRWTAAEIDAELERRPRAVIEHDAKPRDGPA